MRAPTPPQIRI